MRAIIIDDDRLNIKLLNNLLAKYCPDVEVIAVGESVKKAIELVIHERPDILFLDIELHDKTAFEILSTVDTSALEVVLVTAYSKYASTSYKFNITDYLLKPIQITDIVNAVKKCKKNIEERLHKTQAHGFELTDLKYLAIPNNDHTELIDINTILRLESENSYTTIFRNGKPPLITSRSIKDYEQRLPASTFFRVHNSHIINLKFVSKFIRAKNGSVILTDGSIIPIASSKRKELMERIVL